MAEVEAYINHNEIECLECGKKFSFLVAHLRCTHKMTAAEYRERHGIPRKTPLAGLTYRQQQREKIRRMQADGRMSYDHLPAATAIAARSKKPKLTDAAKETRATHLSRMRQLKINTQL